MGLRTPEQYKESLRDGRAVPVPVKLGLDDGTFVEMTAGDLAERFDMTKPTMSHHFAVLKEADLVTSRREGQTIWYGLNTTVVQDLLAWAIDLISGNEDSEGGPAQKKSGVKKS